MLLPPPKATAKSSLKKLLESVLELAQPVQELVHCLSLPLLPRGLNPRRHQQRRRAGPRLRPLFQPLEPREMFYIVAMNDGPYTASNTATLSVAAPGVLANDFDTNGYTLTPQLQNQASHGTVTLNSNGSFTYIATAGYVGSDSFTYQDTNGHGGQSSATVSLTVDYGVLSATDATKIALNTIQVGQQILGTASGAPATAQNLSLVYDSEAVHPDQVLEGDYQLSTSPPVSDILSLSTTYNGTQHGPTSFTTSNISTNNPSIHVAMQIDTSSLATGRYPYSISLSGGKMYGTSTINGYANVVNDASSPVGMGWDIPGLMHVYTNNVQGVPAGVLLTNGTPDGWFFTQGTGNSYTSPNGPYAFDTLTSVTGGGWKFVDKFATTFNFNSSGFLTSRVDRTGETNSYTWTNGLLTSITDNFSRSVTLAYTNGLLSSITNFAGSVWTIAHTGSNLTSITLPNPGGGAPVWQYAYSGNYLSSETNPDNNTTSFTLDSYNRLKKTTLADNSTIGYTAEQDYGYGGSNQFPANGTLTSNVMTSTTDGNGNTSYTRTDAFGDLTYLQDPYTNVSSITRDANGLATQITLPPPTNGAQAPVTNISYDSLGNETSATGAQPTYGTYVYNSFSEPTSFTDSQNHQTTWAYDTHGNITSETDPLNNTVSFTVDSLGYPLTVTKPAPNNGTGTVTTTLTRDSYERLTKITWPDTTFRTFTYSSIDLPTSVVDEDNHTSTVNYDVLGRVTSTVNALNGTVSTTYDKANNVLTIQDEMGNTTSYQYNVVNELTQETLPAPVTGGTHPVLAFTYDSNANKLTYTDALNLVTSFTWDKLNRMTLETLPPQTTGGTHPTLSFAYDNDSRKTSETNALNATTTWAYANTDISQLTSMTLPVPAQGQSSPVWSYAYDTLGRRYQTTDPMNHVQTTSFDADGHVTSVLDNLSHGLTYTYGHGGELLTSTDSLSHATTNQYDSRYRLIQTTDANSGVTSITLDGVGNRTKLTDSVNNQTTWVFDALNRPTSKTNAVGTATASYDASSDVTSTTDANGRVRNFSYDNLHRQTAEQWMNGNTVVATMSYGYDLGNELTSASDPNSAYALVYNGDGQVTSVDNSGTPNTPHVVLTAGYDLAGDVTSQSATIAGTADFLNSYGYDADQRLVTVQQQQQTGGNTVAPKEIDYAYNALGQFTSMAYYNTLSGPRTDVATGAFTYDSGNRLTGLAYTYGGGAHTIDTFGWGYDAANRATSFTSNDGTATYGYDPTNQLTSATYTTNTGGHQPANESYSFDANGNRNMTGWTTGSPNLITSDGTFNYQHDADGNQTVRTRISNSYATDYRTTFTWDYRNRLTDVQYYDNNSVLKKRIHYTYDVFNALIGTQVDPTGSGSYTITQRYVVEGGQPVLQFDGSGNLTERNLIAPNPGGVAAVMAQGAVSSLSQADVVTWMLDDNLGSPRDEVNNSSTVVNHIVYSSFGQDVYESNSSYGHWAGFGGGHDDSYTGLTQDGRRWYDPATGKWLSQDPIGFAGGDADLSRYVGNGPTNGIDPSGLADEGGIGVGQSAEGYNPYVDEAPITNASGSWTWEQYVSQQAQLSGWAMLQAGMRGCWGLMYAWLGIIPNYEPPSNSTAPATNFSPMQVPGMTMFGSYSAAQASCASNPGSWLIAYQFQYGPAGSTTPWTPPTQGALTPAQIPGPKNGGTQWQSGNWCTALYSATEKMWYWEYMNAGPANAFMGGEPQMVYHVPIKPNIYGAGIPSGPPYNTTIYGVYVDPSPPQPWWVNFLPPLTY